MFLNYKDKVRFFKTRSLAIGYLYLIKRVFCTVSTSLLRTFYTVQRSHVEYTYLP